MTSLRGRLFVILLAATGAIWLCAIGWISVGSRSELEHVLDARLQEAARMVHSLAMATGADGAMAGGAAAPAPLPLPADTGYERQLSCQIWSFDGRLIARSSGAPDAALTGESAGFSDREIEGETWRVYTIEDPAKGVRVAVGDRLGLRDRLVQDLVAGLAVPAVLVLPLLGLLIWLCLGRGLRPLSRAAADIAAREGEDMRPVAPDEAPREIQPLIDALNGLFAKVEAARAHEREITAFAAHELRTPLAGLKTQAQVALAAGDGELRGKALRQIIVSVDRTGRLVTQLLALARLDTGAVGTARDIALGALVRDMAEAVPHPPGVVTRLDPALAQSGRRVDRDMLALVLRNLQENAVQHMAAGEIHWRLEGADRLVIEDEGPGIPAGELALACQRFYRGRAASGSGSGLGLAIAQTAAARIGARLTLANRADRPGLRVTVDLGAGRSAAVRH
ncbi:ATP-binding protein [Ancylobacter sp. IITR112]|uniref:sensor histidine kinase n=1 Tax=Ancylobacter sp. IITR112 TaxID=3138073 RepID=UPI00352A71C7